MVGVDILETERVKKALQKDNFLKSICLESEIEYINRFKEKAEHVAGFFVAKEAVMKALEKCDKIMFLDIEIKHKETGKPYVVLHGEAKKIFQESKAKNIEISIKKH